MARGPRQPLSRQTAWGCLTSNLALPGAGTLAAGRPVGYGQTALAIGATVLTMIFGVRTLLWAMANWSRLYGHDPDPSAVFEMWPVMKWALLGIVLFAAAWLWALATSLELLRAARDTPPTAPPALRDLPGKTAKGPGTAPSEQ